MCTTSQNTPERKVIEIFSLVPHVYQFNQGMFPKLESLCQYGNMFAIVSDEEDTEQQSDWRERLTRLSRSSPWSDQKYSSRRPSSLLCPCVSDNIFPLFDKITRWQPRNQNWHWWVGDGGLANGQTGGNALKASLCAEASHIRQSGWQGTVLLEGLSTQPTFLPPS